MCTYTEGVFIMIFIPWVCSVYETLHVCSKVQEGLDWWWIYSRFGVCIELGMRVQHCKEGPILIFFFGGGGGQPKRLQLIISWPKTAVIQDQVQNLPRKQRDWLKVYCGYTWLWRYTAWFPLSFWSKSNQLEAVRMVSLWFITMRSRKHAGAMCVRRNHFIK